MNCTDVKERLSCLNDTKPVKISGLKVRDLTLRTSESETVMLIFEHYEEKNKAEEKKEDKDRRGGKSGTRRRIRSKRTLTMWRTRRSVTRGIM
jgi:hypothetical protein